MTCGRDMFVGAIRRFTFHSDSIMTISLYFIFTSYPLFTFHSDSIMTWRFYSFSRPPCKFTFHSDSIMTINDLYTPYEQLGFTFHSDSIMTAIAIAAIVIYKNIYISLWFYYDPCRDFGKFSLNWIYISLWFYYDCRGSHREKLTGYYLHFTLILLWPVRQCNWCMKVPQFTFHSDSIMTLKNCRRHLFSYKFTFHSDSIMTHRYVSVWDCAKFIYISLWFYYDVFRLPLR